MNADTRRYLAERAARQAPTPQHAIDRMHRGLQLCRDVLAGTTSLPEPPETLAPAAYTACASCYTPILAAPGSRCPACELSETETPHA